MKVFRNGTSPSKREGSVFLSRRYVYCTAISARVYLRCHGVRSLWILCTRCHCTVLSTFTIDAHVCSGLNLCYYCETAVNRLNGRRPDHHFYTSYTWLYWSTTTHIWIYMVKGHFFLCPASFSYVVIHVMEGSSEHGIEPSGSIKCWEVLEWLHNWQLLKKGSAPWVSEWVSEWVSK
jgi:hypothetical protein